MPVYDLPAIDIYCERLNLLLRSVNDLATTTGVCRAKSKAGMLSKRLDKPHSHPEQNFDLQLQALQKVVIGEYSGRRFPPALVFRPKR